MQITNILTNSRFFRDDDGSDLRLLVGMKHPMSVGHAVDCIIQAARGLEYRLPTEAEWEYACRAGSSDAYSFGSDVAVLDEYAWFDIIGGSGTKPVGQKTSNGFGLFDIVHRVDC